MKLLNAKLVPPPPILYVLGKATRIV